MNSTRIDKYCSIDFTPILRLHFVIVKYYDQINLYVSGLFYWHFTYPLIPFVTIRQPCKNICKCISWIRRNWPYEHNKNVGSRRCPYTVWYTEILLHMNALLTVKMRIIINLVLHIHQNCKSSTYYSPRFPESVQSIHNSLQKYLMTDTMLQFRRKREPNSMRFNVIVSITLQRI